MVDMYLASIRPKYAYRIFTGMKKYELRRYFGLKPSKGSIMVVYASGSVKAILGEFIVGEVLFGKPSEIWDMLMDIKDAGVGLDDYSYIKGSRYALAIEIDRTITYKKPITLDTIRNIIPDFNPPMSFRILRSDEPLYELIIRKARSMTNT